MIGRVGVGRSAPAASRRVGWLATAALLSACAGTGHDADRARADADALAQAEMAFAAASRADGMRAAFLATLANDAILFRPGPVDGKAYLAARPDPPVRLEWRPQRVTVAASGELGWSTGPFRVTALATPDRPTYGQFFTIWRKAGNGRWEVLVDLGVGHADRVGWDASLERLSPAADVAPRSSVAAAEAAFARASEIGGAVAAYRAFGATDLRILRDATAPIDGLERVAGLPDADARWTWTPGDATTARSADLGWTLGRYRTVGADGATASGSYVRVWRAERGQWKILGDVLAETAREPR